LGALPLVFCLGKVTGLSEAVIFFLPSEYIIITKHNTILRLSAVPVGVSFRFFVKNLTGGGASPAGCGKTCAFTSLGAMRCVNKVYWYFQ